MGDGSCPDATAPSLETRLSKSLACKARVALEAIRRTSRLGHGRRPHGTNAYPCCYQRQFGSCRKLERLLVRRGRRYGPLLPV